MFLIISAAFHIDIHHDTRGRATLQLCTCRLYYLYNRLVITILAREQENMFDMWVLIL